MQGGAWICHILAHLFGGVQAESNKVWFIQLKPQTTLATFEMHDHEKLLSDAKLVALLNGILLLYIYIDLWMFHEGY